MTTPERHPPNLHAMLKPGIGATFYGSLPRDLDTPQGRDVIRSSDLVCLHTNADSTDVTSAAIVRRINPSARVWLAIPANPLSRLDLDRGRAAAIAEVKRSAAVARDMGAELFELNGEGASSGAVRGDWTFAPGDAEERARLESLGLDAVDAARSVFGGAIGWTSHDGVASFRIPRGLLSRVHLHSPQHYPAQAGRVVNQRELMARVAWSQGQWEALSLTGAVPAVVAPHGELWSPYLQGWGHTLGAMIWGLCEAPVARLWACPGSWSPEAVEALACARKLRARAGFGGEAVENYQRARGLDADGIIGPRTLDSLRA